MTHRTEEPQRPTLLRMATQPWVVCALGLGLAACSSSSSSGDGSPDAGAVVTQDSGSDAAAMTDAYVNAQMGDAAACVAAGGGLCATCCAQTFPGGTQTFNLALQDCLCAGSGSCNDVCTDSDCNALTSNVAACDTCLQQHVDACTQKANAACQADSFCKAATACAAACGS